MTANISPEVAEWLRARAAAEQRSVSNYLGKLLVEHYAKRHIVEEPQATYGAQTGIDEAAAQLQKKKSSGGATLGAKPRSAPVSSSPERVEKR